MNARHPSVGKTPVQNRLVLTFAYHSHKRTLAVPRVAAVIVFLLVPLAAVIYLAATYYLIFHDDVLARLMQHETYMQYAYEDRIAGLQRDVTNAEQRADTNAADFGARLQALSQRQDQVESRTALIAAFADREQRMDLQTAIHIAVPARVDMTPTSALTPLAPALTPIVPAPSSPAADGKPRPAGFDTHMENDPRALPFSSSEAAPSDEAPLQPPDVAVADLNARYDRADVDDLALIKALERPANRITDNVRATLASVGLSTDRFRFSAHAAMDSASGIGGPFVPLPTLTDNSPFSQAAIELQNALAMAEDLRAVLPHVPLNAPLPGDLEVTSPFGPRIDPFLGTPALHTGVDLRGAYGDAVRATAPGRVNFAGAMGGYGNLVEVDNGNGLATRYAHLSSIDVGVGETVATGTVVGHIGDTGRATGPHLHYEVRIDGQPVDPERFLRAGFALAGADPL